jgi:hypothetical protein
MERRQARRVVAGEAVEPMVEVERARAIGERVNLQRPRPRRALPLEGGPGVVRGQVVGDEALAPVPTAIDEGADHLVEGVEDLLPLEGPGGGDLPLLLTASEQEAALRAGGRDRRVHQRRPGGLSVEEGAQDGGDVDGIDRLHGGAGVEEGGDGAGGALGGS